MRIGPCAVLSATTRRQAAAWALGTAPIPWPRSLRRFLESPTQNQSPSEAPHATHRPPGDDLPRPRFLQASGVHAAAPGRRAGGCKATFRRDLGTLAEPSSTSAGLCPFSTVRTNLETLRQALTIVWNVVDADGAAGVDGSSAGELTSQLPRPTGQFSTWRYGPVFRGLA